MALSNWDTLAFNNDGKSCDGQLVVGDASVEIYKNWLHVSHKKMWTEDASFVNPFIAKVMEGDIELARFQIQAVRSYQNSIFCYVRHFDYRPEPMTEQIMAGIGAYGYAGEEWVGVQLRTLNRFLDWLQKVDPDYAKKIRPDTAKRFNQGDAFFAKHVGTDPQVTAPEEAKPTVMSKVLKKEPWSLEEKS